MNTFVLMAGPQNSYKDNLKELTKRYNLTNNFFWSDIILKDMKWGAISASEAMVLSSHGENFGVSLVESLSCSKPVLTTNKVNIYREIDRFKAGFVSNNNVNSFFKILNKFKKLKKNKIIEMKKNSLKCFESNFNLATNKNSLGKFLIKNYYKIRY